MPNQHDKIYDPSICAKIPDMFRDGSSITKVAAIKLGVSRGTYYDWKNQYPEFKAACDLGEQISEVYHETKLEQGADGEIENYNAPSRIFLIKNRFRSTYGEQKEEKSAGDTLLEQLVLGKVKITSTDAD